MGRVPSAMAPTSTVTMAMTAAKIGRSMKKCENFIACRISRSWLRAGGLGSFRRLGLHDRARSDGLQTRHDHLVIRLESLLHDPEAFKELPEHDGTWLRFVFRSNHQHEFVALIRADGLVGDQQTLVGIAARRANADEEAGSEVSVFVAEDRTHAQGARIWIQPVI